MVGRLERATEGNQTTEGASGRPYPCGSSIGVPTGSSCTTLSPRNYKKVRVPMCLGMCASDTGLLVEHTPHTHFAFSRLAGGLVVERPISASTWLDELMSYRSTSSAQLVLIVSIHLSRTPHDRVVPTR